MNFQIFFFFFVNQINGTIEAFHSEIPNGWMRPICRLNEIAVFFFLFNFSTLNETTCLCDDTKKLDTKVTCLFYFILFLLRQGGRAIVQWVRLLLAFFLLARPSSGRNIIIQLNVIGRCWNFKNKFAELERQLLKWNLVEQST